MPTRFTAPRLRPGFRVECLESRDCPAVSFENDYSQDVNGFFTPQRRALLEYAEQRLMPFLQDDLSAITPNPSRGDVWTINFDNTATRQSVIIQNPTIPANVIRVYAWGAPSANLQNSNVLASCGPVGYDVRGRRSWTDTVIARGQVGRLATPATDTSVSAVRLDVNQDAHYYESTSPPPDNANPDLVTAFEHELLHPLGFLGSANPATARWINAAGQFTGPNVEALAGGPVQMQNGVHWAPGTMSNGVLALMTPTITNKRFTPLGLALLADVGWQTGPLDLQPETVVQGDEPDGPRDQATRAVGGLTRFAVGQDVGGAGVQITNTDGTPAVVISPFPEFTGGVRTAMADFNGDGIPDLVVGTGPGTSNRVRILDGRDQHELFATNPFEASFVGGVYLAAADLNGDGVPDLVVSPDEGGGPRCRVFSGKDGFAPMADFLGIDDPNFRGGARVGAGDVNGDGASDLIVSAGFQGGPRVAGFDGKSLGRGTPVKLFNDFFAFEQTLRNGVFITAGDVDGDGFADLVVGSGPGGGPRVLALSGRALLDGRQAPLANFFGGSVDGRGGVRVATRDLNGDGRDDIIVGAGVDDGSGVAAYDSRTLGSGGGSPPRLLSFQFSTGFKGGEFVG